jgi:hypothetical protein
LLVIFLLLFFILPAIAASLGGNGASTVSSRPQQSASTGSASDASCYDFESMSGISNAFETSGPLIQATIRAAGYDCYSIKFICVKQPRDLKVVCDVDKLDGNTYLMRSNSRTWNDLKIVSVKTNGN